MKHSVNLTCFFHSIPYLYICNKSACLLQSNNLFFTAKIFLMLTFFTADSRAIIINLV